MIGITAAEGTRRAPATWAQTLIVALLLGLFISTRQYGRFATRQISEMQLYKPLWLRHGGKHPIGLVPTSYF